MASLLSGLLYGEAEDSLGSHSSGYGGGGFHSGSGIDRSSGYRHSGHSGGGYGHSGGFSGHSGHSGHSGGGDKCCPLVVDALCLAAILGSIGGASFLLARVIQIEINAPGRRKRSLPFADFVVKGKINFALRISHANRA